jgi:hypothetical protein
LWKGEIKLPHVAEVLNAEAPAEGCLQARREPREDVLAVACALLAGLLDLDDLAADQPVRLDHRGVDATGDRPLACSRICATRL